MAESRTDLIHWVNNLCKLNYTKIEQMGTGAAYCQVLDSIFGDVQLSKVKFDAKQEYEYVANFKILQESFDKHKIDKGIPVDKLIKCKMQDNLEFSQWLKKYWDSMHPNTEYDALAKRKAKAGAATSTTAVLAPVAATAAPKRPTSTAAALAPARTTTTATKPSTTIAARQTTTAARPQLATKASPASAPAAAAATVVDSRLTDLETKITELRVTVENLEKERDFYFNKLRDVEILVQTHESTQVESLQPQKLLENIKKILYSTEEGFEVPVATDDADFLQPEEF